MKKFKISMILVLMIAILPIAFILQGCNLLNQDEVAEPPPQDNQNTTPPPELPPANDGVVQSLLSQITTLQRRVGDLTTELEYQTSIAEKVPGLNASVLLLELTIISLTADLVAVASSNATLQAQLDSIGTTIAQLNLLVTTLQNTITYWENRFENIVTFLVAGNVWDIQVLSLHNTDVVLPSQPTSHEWVFLGWSIDGTTIINPLTHNIAADTAFHAVLESNVSLATFMVNGEIYGTPQTIQNGGFATPPVMLGDATHVFTGWSIDGVNVINVATRPITSDTIFVALFRVGNWTRVFDGWHVMSFGPFQNRVSDSVDLTTLAGQATPINPSHIRILFTSQTGPKVMEPNGWLVVVWEAAQWDFRISDFEYTLVGSILTVTEVSPTQRDWMGGISIQSIEFFI